MMIQVTADGHLAKSSRQGDLFGGGDVKQPGKRGGRFYRTEQGHIRYGAKPQRGGGGGHGDSGSGPSFGGDEPKHDRSGMYDYQPPKDEPKREAPTQRTTGPHDYDWESEKDRAAGEKEEHRLMSRLREKQSEEREEAHLMGRLRQKQKEESQQAGNKPEGAREGAERMHREGKIRIYFDARDSKRLNHAFPDLVPDAAGFRELSKEHVRKMRDFLRNTGQKADQKLTRYLHGNLGAEG